ncbi:MAG: DNA mismatch repair protein MutS [Candidatus Omnitrophica bacterium]|nr:DNA mismatch repair protein MutS [Candidatus Omnitrophota bacterium]
MTDSLSFEQKLTPMMEQYRSIKKTLPSDTILFFRLGDFFEMFFEDAVRASDLLNITLTGRDAGESGRVPMCGFPHHAFQEYVRTLLDHNLKVAICEQIGDPKAAKGLVERKITRIISPATYLDDDQERKTHEYMVAVKQEKGLAAFAYLELSTGEFFVREVAPERLAGELALLGPREVILPKGAAEEALVSFVKTGLAAALTVYEDWIFDLDEGSRMIRESFKLATAEGLSFHDRPLAVGACGAILYYLKDHLHSSLEHLRLPQFFDTHDFMVLDRQTQRSLELVSNLAGGRATASLLGCLDQTLTSMGGRTLHQWVTHPLLSVPEITKRQEGIAELADDGDRAGLLRSLFKGVRDLERTVSRLNYGVANARDLENLRLFLERVPAIQKALAGARSAALGEILGAMIPFPNLKEMIEQSIVESPPLTVREGGLIRDGYSRELDELRSISKNGKSWILEFQQREIERTGIKSLRIKYSQVFGYAIEVSKANLHLVPENYIRRQTLANAERFVVPELKDWDQKISGAQDKIKSLEYEIFNEIRAKILEELVPLQSMSKALGGLDALASLAVIARQRKWVRPTVVESGELLIEGGRHPVVEAMLPQGQFVANDTFLDRAENQLVVLTGPNMAGKSTYIRQVGLIVLLAQIGSYVPAAKARIGLVDRIFTRIGASDNLAGGESTFMVEMVETAQILQAATSRSLLILDEVGRGTSTFDGVSIAWAICEHLVQGAARPRTLFATHYHELTQLEKHFGGIKNFNLTVKETRDGIVFLRKVVPGGSERSYGIHVATLAGIPRSVTDRARQILAVLESESGEATQIIEGKKDRSGAAEKNRQPGLFDAWAGTVTDHPLLNEIREMGLDGMTPLEALNRIAAWKERLRLDSKEGR